MRDRAGRIVFRSVGILPRDSALEHQIDEAYHEMMSTDEEGERLLSMLKLRRLCRERGPANPTGTSH